MRPASLLISLALAAVVFVTGRAHGANILFYFGLTGYSHLTSIWPLVELLSAKGHNVTVLTSFQPKSTNDGSKVNVVHVKEIFNLLSAEWDEDADLIEARLQGTHHDLTDHMPQHGINTCKILLQSPTTRSIVYESQFDLVIIDGTFNECAVLLAVYQYKAPFIFYHTCPFFHPFYDEFGVPLETASIPDLEFGYPLTFLERLQSTWRAFTWTIRRRVQFFNPISELARETFNLDHTPSVPDLLTQTSLILSNVHYTTDYARSLPPLFVPIAGIHLDDKRSPIPKEILDFIERPGSDGFVYVSFGTAVRISKSNAEIRQKFFGAMGNQTNLRFVWKWEGENTPANPPKNIYFSKWLPQRDLFAHKLIKGYIGHGGISGVHESIYHEVPGILFPIMGDQDYNVNSLETKGLATVLEITSFTQAELEKAIENTVTNSTLRDQIAEASRIFKDRPMKPLDTAFWWIEYVLRHPKKTYLMGPGAYQSIVERRMLDIIAFVFIVLGVAVFLIYKVLKFWLVKPNQSTAALVNGHSHMKSKIN